MRRRLRTNRNPLRGCPVRGGLRVSLPNVTRRRSCIGLEIRVRSGAGVPAREYIQGRRDLDYVRRSISSIFDAVDVFVTPTIPIPTITLAEMSKDVSTSMQLGAAYLRNTSPFNVYGIPTISVPCGFTRSGLPIGLQVSGPNGGETMVFRVAAAYERATEWHKAPLKSSATVL